jgi:hypothetical protein
MILYYFHTIIFCFIGVFISVLGFLFLVIPLIPKNEYKHIEDNINNNEYSYSYLFSKPTNGTTVDSYRGFA